jgi:hypothetical protein
MHTNEKTIKEIMLLKDHSLDAEISIDMVM